MRYVIKPRRALRMVEVDVPRVGQIVERDGKRWRIVSIWQKWDEPGVHVQAVAV